MCLTGELPGRFADIASIAAVYSPWFDYGNQPGFLARRGVTCQRVRVGLDATLTGNVIADGNHCPPLGAPCDLWSGFDSFTSCLFLKFCPLPIPDFRQILAEFIYVLFVFDQ